MLQGRNRRWTRLGAGVARTAGLAIAPLLLGCFSAAPGLGAATAGATPDREGDRLGNFAVASIGSPPGTIRPSACIVGDHELFLGADLVDPDTQLVVRLVVDPLAGPALRVYDSTEPFDRTVLFFRDECATFKMDLEETGTIVNNIVLRKLALEVDCENEEGATIRGNASAAECL
ncbi:MAG: hypothetical protein ABIU84_06410 [Thermoanaerobaculia bacterium]